MLQVGDKVPLFRGKDHEGNRFDFRDHKKDNLVVFFFPKSLTPTCTVQACNLRDHYSLLTSRGYRVIGISPDPEKLQQKFQSTYSLPFTLLSDEDHTIMNLFGVWGEKQLYGRKYEGVHRTTFIISKGKITGVIPRPKNKDHAREILELIETGLKK